MKRILVLGSKPDASFVDADEVWCANAAIGFYGEQVRRYPRSVNVASAVVLRKNFHDASAHGGLYAKKWRAVAGSRPSRLVLFSAPDDPACVETVQTALRAEAYQPPIEICSVRERIRLVTEVARLRYPVVTRAFFRQPLAVQLKDAERLVRFLGRSRADGEQRDSAGKFRPSTGILALLLAIREHGPDAEYILAGIGLEDRTTHQAGGEVLVGKTVARAAGLPPHVFADIAILRALCKSRRLRTTEPELASHLPMLETATMPARTAVAPHRAVA